MNKGGGTGGAKYSERDSRDRDGLDKYALNKIFVGGLHYDTRDAEFKSFFDRYGKVVSAEVMFNRETHKSRGFGFIVFEVEQSAVKVCSIKEHVIDGKVVEVKRAIPRSKLPAGISTAGINSMKLSASTTSYPSTSATASKPAEVKRAPAAGASVGATATGAAGARKPYNLADTNGPGAARVAPASPAAASVARAVSGATSYAAMLKTGTAHQSEGANSTPTVGASGSVSAAGLGASAIGVRTETDEGLLGGMGAPLRSSGIMLQPLLYGQSMAGLGLKARANSEPVVSLGSSALNGDIMPFEALLLSRSAGGAITRLSSGASSRSGSLAQGGSLVDSAHGESLSGIPLNSMDPAKVTSPLSTLPWLSVPALEAPLGLLPPGIVENGAQTEADKYAMLGAGMGMDQQNLWFNSLGSGMMNQTGAMNQMSPMNQQAFQQAQMAMQQQFMTQMMQQQYMPHGAQMPFLPNPSAPLQQGQQGPPMPSPDMWAQMVSSHEQQQGQGSLPNPNQQQNFPPFMMQPFPYFDGNASMQQQQQLQQQQMQNMMQQQMYFNPNQMQANMNQMQMQYQAQAMALAQAQAQQALGSAASDASIGSKNSNSVSNSIGSQFGQSKSRAGTEVSEADDLFQFSELNLDSPEFQPKKSAWGGVNPR
mmetsp:Transcript_6135/g.13656  ORF Transcript_6135/g.13656 Transcript_6135/m.13656 type:complete len:651 (-) Transcript_6135:2425-4377(-)